ncbi:site-specific DNA-methyltransferase [Thermoleophilia bacterium SCSIO 60948]|nr:site-specific DNA-methyltransferase [Thermoleophilia bacterium SCSIO 60948]
MRQIGNLREAASIGFDDQGSAYSAAPTDARLNAREIEVVERIDAPGDGPEGTLVTGDSLPVLRSLPRDSQVRLAYLDPPFNTHERFRDYRDSLDRRSWLAFMRERSLAVWDLLREDGSIWVHCNDREQAYLRVLLDDLLGEEAFVGTIVWQRRYSRENRRALGSVHDYLHVYAPMGARWRDFRNRLPRNDKTGTWQNPDNDPKGPWSTVALTAQGGHGTPEQLYTVTTPSGREVSPPIGSCWRVTQARLADLYASGQIWFGKNGSNVPRRKVYLSEAKGLVPWSWWPHSEVGHNEEARRELRSLFPDQRTFDTPKPERLIQRIISIATDPGDRVLDPFLGSGTTAAVAQKLGRPWIGCELSEATVRDFAMPRIKAVLEGKRQVGIESIHIGGSVTRCRLASVAREVAAA